MQRCADCANVHDEAEEDDEAPIYRCGAAVPFWVPVHVHDYGSWVSADDGKTCRSFKPKPD